MSYIKGEYYICSNNGKMCFLHKNDSMALPLEMFDALVVMRMSQLLYDRVKLRNTIRRALEHQGNVGCDALCKIRNKLTTQEMLKLYESELKRNRRKKR